MRPNRAELLLGSAYAAFSFAVLAGLLLSGNELTGGENAVAADQLQYLSWVVSASRTFTIDSLWDIPPQTGSLFLHPGFLVSGLLHRAGIGVIPSYEIWKPFSVIAVVVAFTAWVRLSLPAGGQRTAALALALFGLSPVGAAIGWNTLAGRGSLQSELEFVAGEVFAPSWQWGYMMTALAVALMVAGLIAAERQLHGEGRSVLAPVTCAIALLCSWLQPWQGAELIAAVLLCDLMRPGEGGRRRALSIHIPLFVAGLLPLVYYRWLAGSESVWRLAGEANNGIATWSAATWVLAFAIYLPALSVWVSRPVGWRDAATRLVPALMIAQYVVISALGVGTFPFHAIQGIGLFLSVMLVQSMVRWRGQEWWTGHRALAIAGCLVVCVPGAVHRLNLIRLDLERSAQPYFLEADERAALDDLASRSGGGGVLAPIKAGLTVPAHARRPVWVGQISWTPNFRARVAAAEALFDGRLPAADAARLVERSGARFLYSDCGHRLDLVPLLGRRVESVTVHGCAKIYEMRAFRS